MVFFFACLCSILSSVESADIDSSDPEWTTDALEWFSIIDEHALYKTMWNIMHQILAAKHYPFTYYARDNKCNNIHLITIEKYNPSLVSKLLMQFMSKWYSEAYIRSWLDYSPHLFELNSKSTGLIPGGFGYLLYTLNLDTRFEKLYKLCGEEYIQWKDIMMDSKAYSLQSVLFSKLLTNSSNYSSNYNQEITEEHDFIEKILLELNQTQQQNLHEYLVSTWKHPQMTIWQYLIEHDGDEITARFSLNELEYNKASVYDLRMVITDNAKIYKTFMFNCLLCHHATDWSRILPRCMPSDVLIIIEIITRHTFNCPFEADRECKGWIIKFKWLQ